MPKRQTASKLIIMLKAQSSKLKAQIIMLKAQSSKLKAN